MAKKRDHPVPAAAKVDKPATLLDFLRPEIADKLKAKAAELKNVEENRKEDIRKQAEAAQLAEQKRLENDFEHLLNNSKMDWRKNK